MVKFYANSFSFSKDLQIYKIIIIIIIISQHNLHPKKHCQVLYTYHHDHTKQPAGRASIKNMDPSSSSPIHQVLIKETRWGHGSWRIPIIQESLEWSTSTRGPWACAAIASSKCPKEIEGNEIISGGFRLSQPLIGFVAVVVVVEPSNPMCVKCFTSVGYPISISLSILSPSSSLYTASCMNQRWGRNVRKTFHLIKRINATKLWKKLR